MAWARSRGEPWGMRLLCAVDFSDAGRHAAEVAADLARRLRAELTLHHVHAPTGAGEDDEPECTFGSELRLVELADDLTFRFGLHPRTQVTIGPVIGELVAAAGRTECDLLIVGRRRRSRLVAAMVGTTFGDVSLVAPCPVLVVSPGCSLPEGGTVLVGYDVPLRSPDVAACAAAFAQRLLVAVTATHVGARDRRPTTAWERYAARRDVYDRVERAGGWCEVSDIHEHVGSPTRELAKAAEKREAMMVVIGAGTRGWWHRVRGRSVASALPAVSDRPVMIVGPRARLPVEAEGNAGTTSAHGR